MIQENIFRTNGKLKKTLNTGLFENQNHTFETLGNFSPFTQEEMCQAQLFPGR